MPTIHATVILKPRKLWGCARCRKSPNGAAHVSMFGHADAGDPPYRMRICIPCALTYRDEKITTAIEQAACFDERLRAQMEALATDRSNAG